MEIGPQTRAKADPQLLAALRLAASADLLPVLVSLTPQPLPAPAPRSGRAAWQQAREAAFAREAEPLLAALRAAGAQELRPLWLARAVSGRLTPAAVAAAAQLPEVSTLGLVVPRVTLS